MKDEGGDEDVAEFLVVGFMAEQPNAEESAWESAQECQGIEPPIGNSFPFGLGQEFINPVQRQGNETNEEV